MDKIKACGFLTTGIFCFAVVVLLQGISFAGAPILSGVNPTLTPPTAIGDQNPPGYTVSSFLNPIVTDGTLVDDFEDGNITSKWGGTWSTWYCRRRDSLSAISVHGAFCRRVQQFPVLRQNDLHP